MKKIILSLFTCATLAYTLPPTHIELSDNTLVYCYDKDSNYIRDLRNQALYFIAVQLEDQGFNLLNQANFLTCTSEKLNSHEREYRLGKEGMTANFHISEDGILDKPLILVEGYDIDDKINHNALYASLGGDIRNLISEEDIDIITVNFPATKQYLNSGIDGLYSTHLQELIEAVNKMKIGNDKMILTGASMGGLIVRHALVSMEEKGKTHNVGMFIAYDTPNQGAIYPTQLLTTLKKINKNASKGCYKIGKHFTNEIKKAKEQVKIAINKLENKTANQMLLQDNQNTTPFLSKMQERYPKQDKIKNIAFSNGKNEKNEDLPIDGELYTLEVIFPNYQNGNLDLGDVIFPWAASRHICEDSKTFRYSIKHDINRDSVPGSQAGQGNPIDEFNANLHRILNNNIDTKYAKLINYNQNSNNYNYTFIPTDSALDRNQGKSPFDETYVVPNNAPDEHHIQLVGSANYSILVDKIKTFFSPNVLPSKPMENVISLDQNDAANDIRTSGEYIGELSNLNAVRSVEGTGHINRNWDVDKYYFKPGRAGTLRIEAKASTGNTLNIKAGKSSNSQNYFRSTRKQIHSPSSFKIAANDTVHLTVWDSNTAGAYAYNLKATFTPNGSSQAIIVTPTNPSHSNIENVTMSLPNNDGTNSQNDPNGMRSTGKEITGLSNLDNGGTATGSANISRKWDIDRYYFTSPITGKVTIALSNNRYSSLNIKAGTRLNTQNIFRSEKRRQHIKTFNVTAGQTIHFSIWDEQNSNYKYTLKMNFK